jgi:hypothetical protein
MCHAAMHFVRKWHKADMPVVLGDVRFWANSGNRDLTASCPVVTHNRHRKPKFAVMQKHRFHVTL